MKIKFFVSLITLSLLSVSCKDEQMSIQSARAFLNEYFAAIDQQDFDKALDFYINDEKGNKMDELIKLSEAFGSIIKVSCIDSVEVIDEEPCVQLTYKIVHNHLNSNEKLVIVKEDGQFKIFSHQVRSGIE